MVGERNWKVLNDNWLRVSFLPFFLTQLQISVTFLMFLRFTLLVHINNVLVYYHTKFDQYRKIWQWRETWSEEKWECLQLSWIPRSDTDDQEEMREVTWCDEANQIYAVQVNSLPITAHNIEDATRRDLCWQKSTSWPIQQWWIRKL